MEISETTVRDVEYALWVAQEHTRLYHGENHNITRQCRDARQTLVADVKGNVDNPLRIGYTAREIETNG